MRHRRSAALSSRTPVAYLPFLSGGDASSWALTCSCFRSVAYLPFLSGWGCVMARDWVLWGVIRSIPPLPFGRGCVIRRPPGRPHRACRHTSPSFRAGDASSALLRLSVARSRSIPPLPFGRGCVITLSVAPAQGVSSIPPLPFGRGDASSEYAEQFGFLASGFPEGQALIPAAHAGRALLRRINPAERQNPRRVSDEKDIEAARRQVLFCSCAYLKN